MAVPPFTLYTNCRYACICLRLAKFGRGKKIEEGILKIRHFLSCTRTCPNEARLGRTIVTLTLYYFKQQIQLPLPPPSSSIPSNGARWMIPNALLPFQRRQIAKSIPFGCSSNSLQQEALRPWTWLRPPWEPMT